ncbi:DUF1433 domain-containing protein [Staphylococcus caprae]|uniref:DUF1433 domain-containing protein n=1 Tax=Staphylococcus caprae TaxID=29380 RepID=UPI003B21C4CA
MKNKKKQTIFLIGLAVIICLTIGYILHKNKKENYIETQEERINLYFKYNINNYKSMKTTSFKKDPMGGYFVKGYINNNKKFYFHALITDTNNYQFNGDIGYNPKTLGKLFKKDNPKNLLNPSDIIKKHDLDKTKYEAKPPLFFAL